MTEFLADTYALIACLDARPSHQAYFHEHELKTTKMNYLELAYHLIHKKGHEQEDVATALAPFRALIVEPVASVAVEAAQFKSRMREKGEPVSYIDAWGYATARWLEIPFLTGDESFRDVDGVEFVKA